ncbi:MAG: glycerol-3-phosphate dehydrogenase/oxidase [Acidobacteriota bacterium]
MNRETNIARVRTRTEPWDIVVIGGGATGVGCALDAASRGLDVLLLEQHDLGKGTSSRSTKLIHGGVRYLAQGNLSLVRESLKERGLLLRNAPHVVHRQEFVVPCYSRWQMFYYGMGLKIYDLLAGKYGIGNSRTISRPETLRKLPNVNAVGLTGGVCYFDGQFDDARLLVDLATSADKHGAAILNYARVTAINADDRIQTVNFEDALSGETFVVRSRFVINATGAFCDTVRKLANKNAANIVTLSQGIHLVVDRSFLPGDAALMLPKTSDGRVLFVIPWLGYVVVGTTDTPIESAQLEPKALASEIDFILETAAGCLVKSPTRADVRSVFAGIRPLVSSLAARNTSKLSRGHTIQRDSAGMLTITGGKWTTYRQMAEDAVDQAVEMARLRAGTSIARKLPIEGPGESQTDVGNVRLHPALPISEVDVVRAVRSEMAQTVEDVLARRTRCLFLNAKAAVEAAPVVAKIMARELMKDGEWIELQLSEFENTARNYIL